MIGEVRGRWAERLEAGQGGPGRRQGGARRRCGGGRAPLKILRMGAKVPGGPVQPRPEGPTHGADGCDKRDR